MIRLRPTGRKGPPSERARALWQRRMRYRLTVDDVVGSKWAEVSTGNWFRLEAGELEPTSDRDWGSVERMLEAAIDKRQELTETTCDQWGSFYLGRTR